MTQSSGSPTYAQRFGKGTFLFTSESVGEGHPGNNILCLYWSSISLY